MMNVLKYTYVLSIFFILNYSFLNAELKLPDSTIENWEILYDDKIWVGWKSNGKINWCRTKGTIDAPISEVQILIENKKDYPKIFKRIKKTEIITDKIVYIALDMPFPFSDRDYVVKYINKKEGSDLLYGYHAVLHDKVPLYDGYVRLINARGEWRLKTLEANKTEITYTWNGELRGDFPDWALSRAWKQQGMEVIDWLKDALE